MEPFFEMYPEFVNLCTNARRRKIATAMHIFDTRAIKAYEGTNAAGARGEY